MYQEGGIMIYIKRKKETIKSISILLLGIICLCWIKVNLINTKASTEVIALEEVLPHNVEVEESNIKLKVEELYESRGQVINEEEIGKVLTKILGVAYEPQIQIQGQKGSYGVVIIYDAINQEQSLSKAKREQVALIDACLIMSLFNEVDVVTIRNIQEKIDVEKVIYRLDLEDYFQMTVGAYQSQETFVKIASEFLNTEKVTTYWSMKHPFDSPLGETVEKFYKCNFPSQWDTLEDALADVDETLGETLNQQYGYRFWIQGLNYNHPPMNYYAAYQLIQYYGNSNLDEILLELASCKNQSEHLKVQQACDFVMNVLSKALKPDECVIFTTYNELALQAREGLYGIVDNQLIEIATWQGEEPGGFEVVSVSSNKKSVLCKLHTSDQNYLYMIPIDEVGSYKVSETMVHNEDGVLSRELTNLMKEVALNEEMGDEVIKEIDAGNFQSRWLFKNILMLSVSAGESFVYDGEKNSLSSEMLFSQDFNAEYLIEGLKEKFDALKEKEISSMSNGYQIQEVTIDTDQIFIYQYESKRQKNMDLLKEKQNIKPLQIHWSKGKIYVTYEGERTDIIKALDLLMTE